MRTFNVSLNTERFLEWLVCHVIFYEIVRFKAVSLVEAAKYKQLKKRDLLGNSPSGPWQKLTKEHLQSMHQGNDVEIK